jgi:Flp pilus assembly protein TadG
MVHVENEGDMAKMLRNFLQRPRKLTFLKRLREDVRGNALVIAGASLVPLAGLVGGGLDMARAHMAKSRLQQACDAGALAGRRAMSGSELTEAAKAEATKFFNFNFPQKFHGTKAFTPAITRVGSDTVRITASTDIPTTLLNIFGIRTIPLAVACQATNDLENTDIMLVLDVTGSMDGTIGGIKKIASLRKAVMSLYAELEPTQKKLEAAGLRLRYGILPYSQTVNVGRLLLAESPQNMAQKAKYLNCTYSGCQIVQKNVDAVVHSNGNGAGGGQNQAQGPWGGCIQERKTSNLIGPTSATTLPDDAWDLNVDMKPQPSDDESSWSPYLPAEYDNFLPSSLMACPTEARHLAAMSKSDMQAAVDALTPVGGTYHDIGMIWGARMISAGGVFGTRNPAVFNGFPVRKHIIFMTDGLMCPSSLAYSAYGVEYAERRVTTAGADLNTDCNDPDKYTSYQQTHNRRMDIICNQARTLGPRGVFVWVVSFEAPLAASLLNCADPGRAFMATNEAKLLEQFSNIGKRIASLRINE